MTGTLSEADITTRYDFTLVRSDTDSFQTVGFAFAPLGDNPVDSADLTLLGDGVDNQLHTVTFAPGEIYASLHVAVIDDDLLEFDEQAQLQLFETESPAQVLASADLLVQSDDCRVWVSGGGTMNENSGTVDFIVHREDAYGLCPNAWAVAIRVKTAGQGDIRASADDYTVSLDNMDPGPGPDPTPLDVHNYYWVPFQANQSQSVVTVAAVNDSLPEPTEWLKLVLIGGTVAEASPPLSQTLPTQAYAAIEDDDNYLAPPNAPTNLSATPFSNTAITLNWQDNSTDETAFLLEKSTDGVNWSTVQVLEPDTTTATVDNLDPAIDYAFRLRAENPSASVPSDFTPPLPASTQWQNLGAPLAVPITTTGESPIWLNNGESLVAGEGYRLVYSSGGVNYSSQSPPNTWTAASYAVRSEDWNYMHWQTSPFPFVSSLSEVPSIANDLTWSFTSPGAPMALYFNAGDPQYFTGPGVTWQLQKQIPHVSVNLFNGNHTTEGDTTPLQVTLTRDTYFNEPLTVHYTLTPNTADAEDINLPQSGTVTIPADNFSVDVPILATDDGTPEWTEDLLFALAAGPGFLIGGQPVELKFKDNDIDFFLPAGDLVGNWDDDDGNHTADSLDYATLDGGDDDLYEMVLHIPQTFAQGTSVTLQVPVDKLNIYDSRTKDRKLLGDDPNVDTITWNVGNAPQSVFLEVNKGSTDVGDVAIQLRSTDNGDDQVYTENRTAVNLHLRSLNEPIGGEQNIEHRTANWIVGQDTRLLAVVEAPEVYKQATTYRWTVPGSANYDYVVTAASGTLFDLVDSTPGQQEGAIGLAEEEVEFFWVPDGGSFPSSRTVTLNVGLVGGMDYSISTDFILSTPTISTVDQTWGLVGMGPWPGLFPNFLGLRPNPNAVPAQSEGTRIAAAVSVPGSFSGEWGFTQVVQPDVGWTNLQLTPHSIPNRGVYGLDNSFHYNGTWTADGQTHHMSDSPGVGLNPNLYIDAHYDASFTTTVMFKPAGDHARWVPLAAIYWSITVHTDGTPLTVRTADGTPGTWEPATQFPEWTIIHHPQNF